MRGNVRDDEHELTPLFMMANILGQMLFYGNNLGTIGEGCGETVWDDVTPICSIILNVINRLGEFHDIQRRPKKCIKKVQLNGYEPRGRGFNSCQPHQKVRACNCKVTGPFLIPSAFKKVYQALSFGGAMNKAFTKESDDADDDELQLPSLPAGGEKLHHTSGLCAHSPRTAGLD